VDAFSQFPSWGNRIGDYTRFPFPPEGNVRAFGKHHAPRELFLRAPLSVFEIVGNFVSGPLIVAMVLCLSSFGLPPAIFVGEGVPRRRLSLFHYGTLRFSILIVHWSPGKLFGSMGDTGYFFGDLFLFDRRSQAMASAKFFTKGETILSHSETWCFLRSSPVLFSFFQMLRFAQNP